MRNEICGWATTTVIILCLSWTQTALGTSSKYKRASKRQTDQNLNQVPDTASTSGASGSATAPSNATDSKVDLSNLENKYWTAQDTEFKVVQNRLYTKAKRFSYTLFTGPILNNEYTNDWNFGAAINYYFSEREGVELFGWKTSSQDNDVVNNLVTHGAYPNHNMPEGFLGAAYNWVPVYAKLSLLEKKILYFDLSVSPGLGVTFMSAAEYAIPPTYAQPPSNNQAAPTGTLDIAEEVFLSNRWALRLDFRNQLYPEKIYKADTGGLDHSTLTYYSTIMVGFTFFQ